MRRLAATIAAGAAAVGFTLALAAGPAAAHVTVNPGEAEQGSFTKLTFRVPNESDTAGTTLVEVEFPTDPPVAFVSVKPTPGWTATVERAPLAEPVEGEGEEITETVSKITWTADPGVRIEPGEFQEFDVSAGPLPETDSMLFPTLQTYDDGEVSRWIEETPPGGEEPESPAPVLTLVAASGDEHGSDDAEVTETEEAAASTSDSDDSDTAKTLGIVGIVVGGAGLLVAIVALVRARRA